MEAFLIAVTGQKGGGGKTTVGSNLASGMAANGLSVAVIDTDSQASFADWADGNSDENIVVQSSPPARLGKTIDAARASGADVILVDTGAKSGSDALEAVSRCDINLIVARPSVLDLRAIRQSVEVAKLANALERTFVLLNAVPAQGSAGDDAEAVVGSQYGIGVVPVRLAYRAAYQHAFTASSWVGAWERNGKAAAEVAALVDWVSTIGRRNADAKAATGAK